MLLLAAHEFTLGPTSLQGPLQHADVKTNGIWLYRYGLLVRLGREGRNHGHAWELQALGKMRRRMRTEMSLEVQWLRLHTPNAGRPSTGRTDG